MDENVLCKGVVSNSLKTMRGVLIGIGIVVFIILWFAGANKDKGILFPVLGGELVYFIGVVIFYISFRDISMTVTDKRVYGTTAFGKRVDLPMDSVSAVSTSLFDTIGVSTSSGVIKFSFIGNKDAMFKAISEQIALRQNRRF